MSNRVLHPSSKDSQPYITLKPLTSPTAIKLPTAGSICNIFLQTELGFKVWIMRHLSQPSALVSDGL